MNSKILAVLLSIICFKFTSADIKKRYDNFSLYKTTPMEVDHVKFLQNINKEKYMDVIFWQKAHKLFEDVHLMVNPKDEKIFIERTQHFGITVEKLVDNIQKLFDAQAVQSNPYLRLHPENYNWETYHTLTDINQWLQDIAITYPKIVKLKSIGKSTEGRDIFAIEFKNRRFGDTVIVEGGIHGNEWVAVEFVTFLINELLKVANGTGNSNFKKIADKHNWCLAPVLNPDGYDYNQKVDRMWKKNRRYVEGGFVGVNLDRNFDYSFGQYDSSFDPKDDNFCGVAALSEPETQAWTDYVDKNSHNLKFYFSFHAYGQRIIIPYGDTVIHLENFGEMENYARQAAIKMFRHSSVKYRTGTTYDTLGLKNSGDSASWVKKTYNVKYVFTILLRDDGSYGYGLPKEQILPTCEETLTGITEIMTAKPRKLRTDMFSSRCKSLFGKKSISLVPMSIMMIPIKLFIV